MNWLRKDLIGPDGKSLSIFDTIDTWLKAAKKKDGPKAKTNRKARKN